MYSQALRQSRAYAKPQSPLSTSQIRSDAEIASFIKSPRVSPQISNLDPSVKDMVDQIIQTQVQQQMREGVERQVREKVEMKVNELKQKFREQVDKHVDQMILRGHTVVSKEELEQQMIDAQQSDQDSDQSNPFANKYASQTYQRTEQDGGDKYDKSRNSTVMTGENGSSGKSSGFERRNPSAINGSKNGRIQTAKQNGRGSDYVKSSKDASAYKKVPKSIVKEHETTLYDLAKPPIQTNGVIQGSMDVEKKRTRKSMVVKSKAPLKQSQSPSMKNSMITRAKHELAKIDQQNQYISQDDQQLFEVSEEQQQGPTKFIKKLSVFRDFAEETKDTLKKMFDKDYKYSKINLMSNDDQFESQFKAYLLEHYKEIRNVFMYLVSYSETYPTLNFQSIVDFAGRSQMFSQDFNVAGLEQCFKSTAQSNNIYKQNSQYALNRYEFMELIVRLGQIKYQESKEIKQKVIRVVPVTDRKTKSFMFTTQHILNENVFKFNVQLDNSHAQAFRKEYLYTLDIEILLSRNMPVIEQLFNHYSAKKSYITLTQALNLFRTAGFVNQDTRIRTCFIQSLMPRIDTMKNQGTLVQLQFVEFLVFIGRASHEIYNDNPPFDKLDLKYKIDQILIPLLAIPPLYLTKLYSIDDDK